MQQGLEKAKQLCATIGLTLDFTYTTINKIFDSQKLNTDVVNGWGVNPQQILAFKGTEDLTVLISTWTKITPNNFSTNNPINPCTYDTENGICMEIMEEWYADMPEVLTQFFLHELTHYFYDKTHTIPDLTHQQFANSQYSQKPPIDYYLYLISTLYKPPQAPTSVVITRSAYDAKQTLGSLVVGDKTFGCVTLERPDLANQPNISCIPKGTYLCQWKFKLNSLSYHYQVMNVPGRTGIFIHQGTFFFNSLGCILLGSQPTDANADGEKDLLNSKSILASFEKLMGKKDFQLTIQ